MRGIRGSARPGLRKLRPGYAGNVARMELAECGVFVAPLGPGLRKLRPGYAGNVARMEPAECGLSVAPLGPDSASYVRATPTI